MSAPRVALTTSLDVKSGPFEKPRVSLYAAYIEALQAVGLAPVLVTPAHTPETIESLLDVCEGLVLSGGGDIDPARFGATPSPLLDYVLPERDAVEFAALEIALERDLPVLGICRGCQVLNVYMGGTLYQDIGAERPDNVGHRQTASWSAQSHDITVTADSRLAAAVGAPSFHVNTFHHQAIRDIAPRLAVTAVAEDGLIEAVEARDHTWVVAVQWHPERSEAQSRAGEPDRRLFAAFADAVLTRRGAALR